MSVKFSHIGQKTKTKMGRKRNGGSFVESNSFALFSDDPVVPVVCRYNDSTNCKGKKSQEVQEDERTGAQSADEKPEHVESANKEAHSAAKRGFRAIQNAQGDSRPENTPVREERHGNEKPDKGDRKGGESEKRSDGSVKGQVKRIRRSKQKVQETEGGSGTGKDDKTFGETVNERKDVDYDKIPLAEFEASSKVFSKKITGKPRDTEDPFTVEVVIDNLRYRVSRCSIKGDTYVQGLDSRFIVSKLITKK